MLGRTTDPHARLDNHDACCAWGLRDDGDASWEEVEFGFWVLFRQACTCPLPSLEINATFDAFAMPKVLFANAKNNQS